MAYQQWITTEEEDLYLLYHQAAQRALYEGSPAYESKLLSKSKKFDHHNAHTTTEFGRVQPESNRRERPQPFNTLARRNFRARGIRGYTSAYHDFVNQNNKKLLTKIEATITSHVDELDEASAIIQAEFRKQKFSTKLRNEIAERLSELDPQVNLAIRSSATCEDMPDASFAGQHDTYLNIPHSQVEENIVECFASLFTPRAISYRKRNNLSEVDAGMAVVCQCMASNQTASGVLFTANHGT